MRKKMTAMKVALSIDNDGNLYKQNLWTAPKFVIFEVFPNENYVEYTKVEEKDNPWSQEDESVICDPMACEDGCSDQVKEDINHLSEHYIILEAIKGCEYFLSNFFCGNIQKVLENANIKICPYPLFIKKPEIALNNFLISCYTPKNSRNGIKIVKI